MSSSNHCFLTCFLLRSHQSHSLNKIPKTTPKPFQARSLSQVEVRYFPVNSIWIDHQHLKYIPNKTYYLFLPLAAISSFITQGLPLTHLMVIIIISSRPQTPQRPLTWTLFLHSKCLTCISFIFYSEKTSVLCHHCNLTFYMDFLTLLFCKFLKNNVLKALF